MKVLVIANPVSGGGRARKLAEHLVELLAARGHAVELFLTSHAGHASAHTGRLDGHDRLVVVGGDGTLNEVLNGLPDPSCVPLAQLATGTANILAHELGLPRTAARAVRWIEQGEIRRVDMGLAGRRRFLMVVSAGFDAMVTHELSQARGRRLGYRGYLGPIARVLRSYEPPSIEIEIDDGPRLCGELVIISNTRNYGGLFTMADRACCDSGHFDVCVLHDASLAGLVRAGARGLSGRGLSAYQGATYATGTRLRLQSAGRREVDVEVDGDWFGTTPLEVSIVPRLVPIVTTRMGDPA